MKTAHTTHETQCGVTYSRQTALKINDTTTVYQEQVLGNQNFELNYFCTNTKKKKKTYNNEENTN